ncbi:MAG: DUF2007 domain-containing protein [Actinobacteria bacterium]|nr:DUF2007 domain-containing protein [Actinomycetota bacterium]
MAEVRMVPLARVPSGFHARVLAARLGSEGVVTQLRGGGVDGPYPMGAVEVLVDEPDLALARELLLVDEVESAFDDDGEGPGRVVPVSLWFALLLVLALVVQAYASAVA